MFRSKQAAPVSEHAKLRSLQISKFLEQNPTAQLQPSAQPNDPTTTYLLHFQTGSAGPLTLHVVLGPLFPERPPACQLTTNAAGLRLSHRYLDASGFLSLHPKLQPAQWTPHSNLGLLIQSIVSEIVQQPPQLVGGQAPAFSAQPQQPSPAVASYNSYGSQPQSYSPAPFAQPAPYPFSSQSSQQSQQLQPPANGAPPPRQVSPAAQASSSSGVVRTRPPEVPTSFPLLDSLSIADLEDVLSGGDEAVHDMAHDAEAMQQILRVARDLTGKVESKAKDNLAARVQLEILTAQLASETARLKETAQQNASLLQRQQRAQSRFSLPVLLHQLDAAIATAEEESDASKERFEAYNPKTAAAGAAEDQGLLEVYIKQRMTMHGLAGKKERLTETYGRQ